jgi:hypothetical protein
MLDAAVSYAGGVSGGSIIIIGGEFDLGNTTAGTSARQDDGEEDEETNEAGRRIDNRRVEGELYDEETEQWFSLPHIRSGLGPGRTHAATTCCRMLNFAPVNRVLCGDSSNSIPSMPAEGSLATDESGGLTFETAGAKLRRGGLVTSMTESTDQVRYSRNARKMLPAGRLAAVALLLHCGLLNDAILAPLLRRITISGATLIPARRNIVEFRTAVMVYYRGGRPCTRGGL